MELEQLLETIGHSVQQAQLTVERNAISQYFTYFERLPAAENASVVGAQTAESCWTPKTEALQFSTGGKPHRVAVPVTTLVSHASLGMEEIRIKLRVGLQETSAGGLQVEVEGSEPEKVACQNEIELAFQRRAPAEGMARLEQTAAGQL